MTNTIKITDGHESYTLQADAFICHTVLANEWDKVQRLFDPDKNLAIVAEVAQ